MHSELLELCGFSPEEAEKEGSRVDRAFQIAGISAEDVKQAEARIKRYYDIELTGMRKLLGVWLKEFVDAVLSKEEGKKVLYYSFPPVSHFAAAMALMSPEVYAVVPELLVEFVLGAMFGKIRPVLEEAEKYWLPPGHGHCPMLQARLGSLLKGIFPVPDLLVPSCIACEQAPETDEIIAELFDVPVAHVDSRGDSQGENWPYVEPWRIQYMVAELKDAAKMIEKVTGHEMTDEVIVRGIAGFNSMGGYISKIQMLRKKEPQPLSMKDFHLLSETRTTCGRRAIQEGPEAAAILVKEIEQRVNRGIGVMEKGAPRVAIIIADYENPSQIAVIEKAGLNAILSSTEITEAERAKPTPKDVWEQIADAALSRPSRHSAMAFIKVIKSLSREYEVDGVILASLARCRVYCVFPLKTKEVIEAELGIPAIAPEHDPWDSREFTPELFRSRVEPFAEMLKERKGSQSIER